MYPILFTIGSFHFYTLSVFLIFSWCVFSFLFWKHLRVNAVEESKIFDLTFYATIVAVITSRALFVFFRPEFFTDNYLKIPALWIQPGLSFLGALVGITATIFLLSKRAHIRVGLSLDALAIAIAGAGVVGAIGVFFDGGEIGRMTTLPWGISYPGISGTRHPVGIYEIIIFSLLAFILAALNHRAVKRKWRFGSIGVWFFLLWSMGMFIVEFFKESAIYWSNWSPNQWILLGIFAESLGAVYVRGGGREVFNLRVKTAFQKVFMHGRHFYGRITKRHSG